MIYKQSSLKKEQSENVKILWNLKYDLNAKSLQETIGLKKKVSEVFQNAHQNEEVISKHEREKESGRRGKRGDGEMRFDTILYLFKIYFGKINLYKIK